MDKRIGAQLFTVRDYTQTIEDFEESMEKVAKVGYKVVQLSAVGNLDPKEIKRVCDKYGLIVACTHRAYNEYTDKMDFMIDFHKTCGCKYAGLGAIPTWDGVNTAQQAKNITEDLNKIARKLKENGLNFVYHNHAIEFKKINGKYLMDYFLENGEFDFIIDVYWLAVAGINPAEFIRKNSKRIKMIHFKDLKVKNNAPAICEVMEGNLDWDDIIAASFESDAEYALVEQDTCDNGDPFKCLETSYNNLKTKGFN